MPFERKWLLGFVDENGELRAMANVDSRQRGALGPPRRRGGQRPGGAIVGTAPAIARFAAVKVSSWVSV